MDDVITKSSTGLDGNVAGALCYALGWVTGVIFLIIEKESKFVRFHAMQSILFGIAFMIIFWIIRLIPFLGWFLWIFVWLAGFVLWIFLMYKAYKGVLFKLPVIGDIAAKQME
jgi:uncharacterized membrane protein